MERKEPEVLEPWQQFLFDIYEKHFGYERDGKQRFSPAILDAVSSEIALGYFTGKKILSVDVGLGTLEIPLMYCEQDIICTNTKLLDPRGEKFITAMSALDAVKQFQDREVLIMLDQHTPIDITEHFKGSMIICAKALQDPKWKIKAVRAVRWESDLKRQDSLYVYSL